jgi:hypothetical protein
MSDTVRALLEAKLQTDLSISIPGTPVNFLNTRFTTPTVPWVHVAVLPNITRRAAVTPANEFSELGCVNVTCMCPESTGSVDARKLADAVINCLADRTLSIPGGGMVTSYETTQRDRGVINGWYTVNVLVSYRARIRLPGR